MELNSYTNGDGEIIVEVEELILYNEVLWEADYNHEDYEGFEEVYIYEDYGSAMKNHIEDYVENLLSNSEKHSVTVNVFDALKDRCIKVICNGKSYIIVKL